MLPLLFYTRDDWAGVIAELAFFFMGYHVFTELGKSICPKNLQINIVNESIRMKPFFLKFR